MTKWGLTEWRDALTILSIVAGFASVIAVLYLRSNFATRREHETLFGRVMKLEQAVTTVATADDINRVMVAIERQNGERKALAATVQGISHRLDRFEKPLDLIQEHLMRDR